MQFSFEGGLRIETDSIKEATEAGRYELNSLEEKEKLLVDSNVVVRQNSAEHTHLRFFQTNQKTRDVSRNAVVGLATAAELGNK